MLHNFLQLWGGLFYLLNKIFFSRAERNSGTKQQRLEILTWVVYLIGLPAWVWLFVANERWIAASVEAGGAISMVLGLLIAKQGLEEAPPWLDNVARTAAALGICYSLYGTGGTIGVTQMLELGLTTGFLVGTYYAAKRQAQGYLWLVLMHCSTAMLMYLDGNQWLVLQQLVSLGFVADAYIVKRFKGKRREP